LNARAEPGAPARGSRPRGYWLVDVDGTLLNSRGEISARNRIVLERAARAGIEIVLATGRSYPSLMRVTGGWDLPFHCITNGGAVALTPRAAEVRYLNALPAALWRRITNAILAEGLSPVVFAHRHPETPLLYVQSRTGNPHFEAYLGRNALLARVTEDLIAGDIPDVIEVAALGRGTSFEQASQRIMTRFDGETRHHCMVLFINAEYGKITEFFHPLTSKWQAFLGLFPEAATCPDRVVAVGDEANDIEMIAAAGLGIAMGNATPALKAVADRTTEDNDHDGLAVALEPLLME